MKFARLLAGAALGVTMFSAGAQAPAIDVAMTMSEAMSLAERADRQVRAREAQLAVAEATSLEAESTLFSNPEISLGRTRRNPSQSDGSINEWSVGIAQPFETGGQSTHRREAAAAALDALRAEIAAARRLARASAALRYIDVLAAQRRLRIEQRSADLFAETARAIARRRAAGEDTRLDANVALIEAERARNALSAARERLLDARGELATLLQLPAASLPQVDGELKAQSSRAAEMDLDRLLISAQPLPDLQALAARAQAARARYATERAARYPDVTVGLGVGREGAGDGRERVTMLTFSVPLPIFKRNGVAIGQARTEVQEAEIARSVAARDVPASIRRLWSRIQSQRERVERLVGATIPASDDNQRLVGRSRQSGQIGLLEQLIVNRQALDAERDLTDALAELHMTRVELESAAGLPIEAIQ